jgi:3'-5' exoribonuclease
VAQLIEQPNLIDVNPGETIQGFYVLRKCEIRTSRKGSAYLALELGDRSGRISGKIWQDAENYYQELKVGEVVKIRGTAQEYQGVLDLSVDKIKMATEEDSFDPDKLIKMASEDLDALYDKILERIDGFQNEHLKGLLQSIFGDKEFRKQFCRAPGGKLWHHAQFGGLVVHTESLMEVCQLLAGHYPEVDEELLITGALLHDVGKIEEFGGQWAIDYTDYGRLVGHLTQGVIFVDRAIQKMEDFPPELRMQLLHLIVSHHGETVKGSPIVPKTVEALILTYLDELDAQINAWRHIIERDKDGHSSWSSFIPLIDRHLYLGQRDEEYSGDSSALE